MFEDEVKMEEHSSNIVPLLMALGLAVAVVGGLVYFILQSKRTLTQDEATQVVTAILKAQGPATVHFHAGGRVEPSVDEKPFDPHYKFLEKIGVVKLGKATYKGVDVTLTANGEALLKQSGASEAKNPDGTEGYTVPLASRKLLAITDIQMVTPGLAKLSYSWKWEPTKLGEDFDIKSPAMSGLKTWESAMLIQKYGADYYTTGEVKKVALTVLWDDKNKVWKPAEQ